MLAPFKKKKKTRRRWIDEVRAKKCEKTKNARKSEPKRAQNIVDKCIEMTKSCRQIRPNRVSKTLDQTNNAQYNSMQLIRIAAKQKNRPRPTLV